MKIRPLVAAVSSVALLGVTAGGTALLLAERRAEQRRTEAFNPPVVRRGKTVIEVGQTIAHDEWARFAAEAMPPSIPRWGIRGRLVLPDGTPAPRSTVFLEVVGADAGAPLLGPIASRSDDEGVFQFSDLPRCRVARLRFGDADVQFDGWKHDVAHVGGVAEPVITVHRLSTVRLVLSRADGGPVGRFAAGVRPERAPWMSWRLPARPETPQRASFVDAPGSEVEVVFERLTRGPWSLVIATPEDSLLSRTLEVEPGRDRELESLTIGERNRLTLRMERGDAVGADEPLSVIVTSRLAHVPEQGRGTRTRSMNPSVLGRRVEVPAVTGDEVVIDGISEGRAGVQVANERGTEVASALVMVEAPETTVTVPLVKPALLRGRILEPDGRALQASAIVTVRTERATGTYRANPLAHADGRFELQLPGEESYEFQGRKTGDAGNAPFPRAETFLTLRAGETRELDVALGPTGLLTGDASPSPSRDRDEALALHWRNGSRRRVLPDTSRDGIIAERLPAGEYDVFDGPDFLRAIRIDLGTAPVRVQVPRERARVIVRAHDEAGRPVPYAFAYLDPLAASPFVRETVNLRGSVRQPDGTIAIEDVRPGIYDIVAVAPGFQRTRSPLIVAGSGSLEESVTLRRGGGAVRLRVVDGVTGRAMPLATFARGRLGGLPSQMGGRLTDLLGETEIRDLPPETMSFDVVPPAWPGRAYAPARVTLDPPAADSFLERDVELLPATPVRVAVLDRGGRPIEDIVLSVEPLVASRTRALREAMAAVAFNPPRSAASGVFTRFALPSGISYSFRVSGPGRTASEATVAIAGELEQTVVLRLD